MITTFLLILIALNLILICKESAMTTIFQRLEALDLAIAGLGAPVDVSNLATKDEVAAIAADLAAVKDVIGTPAA